MTSHWNGNHSKSSLSLSLAVLCDYPSYITASRCARTFRLKELNDRQDLTVRGSLFNRKAPEKEILVLNMVYPWPRQTKLIAPRVGTA